MNIEKNSHGAYVIADIVTDGRDTWREAKQFYGYTKREAIARYREHLLENKYILAPEY